MFFGGISRKQIRELAIFALVAYIIITALTEPGRLMMLILTLPGLLLAITVHEFSHAYTAYKLGDKTPQRQGRLSFHPKDHVEPMGLVSLFVFGIGWGKPVQYNPNNIRDRKNIEKAEQKIALAGPVSNFIIAFILSIILILMKSFITDAGAVVTTIYTILSIAYSLNIGLGVFNLIPIPPLDGYKVLYPYIKGGFTRWIENNMIYVQIIFLILIFTGALSSIIGPVIEFISNIIMWLPNLILKI